MRRTITQEMLKALLDYDPATGTFRWRNASGRHGRIPAGSVAGNINIVSGYRLIGIGGSGKTFRASNLAWLWMTGEWPSKDVDHVNQSKSDDRFGNLRLATAQQNKQNSPKYRNNKSGFKGVHFAKDRGRYRAQVSVDGKCRVFGSFATAEEAALARDMAVREVYGDFASLNMGA